MQNVKEEYMNIWSNYPESDFFFEKQCNFV